MVMAMATGMAAKAARLAKLPGRCLPRIGTILISGCLALASTSGLSQTFRLNPYVELGERYTDNILLTEDSSARKDWVTDVSTGFRLERKSSRADLSIDYRLNRLFHSRQSSLDRTEKLLSSRATIEAVENWFFVDAFATISQENRSAFGVAGLPGVSSNIANRVETRNVRINPYVRGSVSDIATYQLRFNAIGTRTADEFNPNTSSREWTGFIRNTPGAGRLGWSLDGNSLDVKSDLARDVMDARLRGGVTVAPSPQLHLAVNGGFERSNLDTEAAKTTATYGVGIDWAPSDRTKLAAVSQKRFFGFDHAVALGHRTRLTAWRFSSSKEVTLLGNRLTTENAGSVQSLLLDLLASTIVDPIGRAEAIQRRYEQTGIPASTGFSRDFVASRPYLNRRQEESVALLGIRNTLSLNVGQQTQRAFGSAIPNQPGITRIEDIRQSGFNLAWAYRLSPVSTLRLELSRLRTESLDSDALSTTQQLQSIFFVTQLGAHTTASFGLRRVDFDSTLQSSHRENSAVSSLSVRF